MKSVRDVLLAGQQYLIDTGHFPAAQARREVELLLAELLHCKRLDVYIRFEQPLHENDLNILRDQLKRRAKREPLQWLLGYVEFCGRKVPAQPEVFIARPETEEWVDWLRKLPSELFGENISVHRLLEIGTGSGAIICTLLAEWQAAHGVGVEKMSAPAQATRELSKQFGVDDRLQVMEMKGGQFRLEDREMKFDVVVSNPPYIAETERSELAEEVLHDPAEALFAGVDGLDAYRLFARKLPEWLKPGGAFVFEIGSTQSAAVMELLLPIAEMIFTRADLAGLPRVVAGRLK